MEPSASEAYQYARAVAKASAKGPSGSEAAEGGEESGKLRKRVPVGPKAATQLIFCYNRCHQRGGHRPAPSALLALAWFSVTIRRRALLRPCGREYPPHGCEERG